MPPSSAPLLIDLAESFPHLSRAPISEAVFQIRGRALASWEEAAILPTLKASLPDYPKAESSRTQQITVGGKEGPVAPVVDLGWSGAVLRSPDGRQVANFQRDSFTLSRLAPYQNWETFSSEAFRLYDIHLNLAQPAEAQRIGLRFINQFDAPSDSFDLGDIFIQPPPAAQTALQLSRARFFHQDTYSVPDFPYFITVTRTLQPAAHTPIARINPKLILDIDVFTNEPFSANLTQVRARLEEMRWLKNKIFFGSLTPTVIASFR